MPEGYSSQRDYIEKVADNADTRQKEVESALRDAFSKFIETREVEVIVFSDMSSSELAEAILAHPIILKPILASCNIAGRAIERDLGIKNLNTYSPRLSHNDANAVAGYIKSFLPPYLELPAISRIDRVWYIDKEIRKDKGRWERLILKVLNRYGGSKFLKRKFKTEGEEFEMDAATPKNGDIRVGVDIKRIEARRDIHKRCDEIVNKAAKLKSSFPQSKFGAVIYYPFVQEQINIQNRLGSSNIDGVVFASDAESSIENAVRLLLSKLGVVEE
ncbi:hypothetical protein KAX06_00185 [candidate division WOR-3 bacterium]|nr:hypothetical protein [candidate division WOR-3 bacterium]